MKLCDCEANNHNNYPTCINAGGSKLACFLFLLLQPYQVLTGIHEHLILQIAAKQLPLIDCVVYKTRICYRDML